MDTPHENRERVSHAHLPRVVIVGGGFGGLYAARGLAQAPVTVTIIDKHNYHLFRPLLYEVATGLLSRTRSPHRSAQSCDGRNAAVLMAEVRRRPARPRRVHTRGHGCV